MKNASLVVCLWYLAGSMAGAAVTALQSVDNGGARAGSGTVVADQSIGGIVGISSVASPTETMRHGYIGQLTDVAGFAVQAETNAVDEGGSQQLSGAAMLDDDTVQPIEGSEVAWVAAAFPLACLSVAGLATATNVYEDTLASVTGQYQSISGAGSFLVRDVDPDNFGSYAGDGLPDGWQVGYFGVGNPEAGPTNNMDLDPFDNTEEWIADTIPTNGDSYFGILHISNAAPHMAVAFQSSSARRYNLEATTNLVMSDWFPISGQTNLPGNDTQRWLVHSNAPAATHYRVTVHVP